mmetsp:Transcript_16206/g.35903  ORF Transcript_16206/g.35903 Transcript_16206/m.35903 type:complete len:209 (-) Transcript_16206:201-827(-)
MSNRIRLAYPFTSRAPSLCRRLASSMCSSRLLRNAIFLARAAAFSCLSASSDSSSWYEEIIFHSLPEGGRAGKTSSCAEEERKRGSLVEGEEGLSGLGRWLKSRWCLPTAAFMFSVLLISRSRELMSSLPICTWEVRNSSTKKVISAECLLPNFFTSLTIRMQPSLPRSSLFFSVSRIASSCLRLPASMRVLGLSASLYGTLPGLSMG